MSGWDTNVDDLAKAVAEFERVLPGFWWSAGVCHVGAYASCAVSGSYLPEYEFKSSLDGGTPSEALRDVMAQALAAIISLEESEK